MIINYLFVLLPLTIITGPFLPDLIICLIGINFLIIKFKKKNFKFFESKFVILFLLFFFYLLIRSLLSANILLSLESSLFYFRYLFFILGAIYIIKLNPQLIKWFAISLFLSLVICYFSGISQIFFDYNLLGENSPRQDRLVLFEEELIIGSFVARTTPILIGLIFFLDFDKKLKLFLLSFASLMSLFIIFMSGERTALFIFLFFIISMIILSRFRLKFKFIFFSALIVISSIFIFTNDTVKDRVINQTILDLNLLNENNNQINLFSEIHQGHMISAYKMFKSNVIFGHGPKLFRDLCDSLEYKNDFSCSSHPHNTYIQLLAETGLVGFLFIFSFFIFLFYFYFKIFLINNLNKKSLYEINNFQLSMYLILFINLWPIMPSNNFFNNWISVLYYLPIPFIVYFFRSESGKLKKLFDNI
jgi:O-antigen ligase